MYENTPHIPRNRRDSRLTEYPAERRPHHLQEAKVAPAHSIESAKWDKSR